MLIGHRRYLLRQATGPTAGEVAAGDVNVLVGAFSDAQLYEDPWTTPPQWTPTSWEPASLSRASGGRRSARGHGPVFRGEAIPYMIGAVKVGNLHGRGGDEELHTETHRGEDYEYESAPVGDLSMVPVWTQQDRETWEPHGLGDFRTSEIYSGNPMHRRYTGEAIPGMVGALPGMRARQSPVSQVEKARPSFKANEALAKWVGPTEKNQISPTGTGWSACNDDNTTCAYGTVFQVGAKEARIALAEQAKQIALLHRVFTNVVPLAGGKVLVYFSNDPAAIMVADDGASASVTAGLFGIKVFDRKPEKLKEKLSQLEAKLAKWKAGESKPGFGESQEGLIKRINTLRKKLNMPELDSEGDLPETETKAETKTSGFVLVGNLDDDEDDEMGRAGRKRRSKRRKKKRKARRQRRQERRQDDQGSSSSSSSYGDDAPAPQIVVIDRGQRDAQDSGDDDGGSDDSEDD